jgi:hypothetical protein
MYKVRYKIPGIEQVAYKFFKTFDEAKHFSESVDLIEIKEVDYE